jgi:hypothetical protein
MACVQCSPTVYAFSSSFCRCTSGRWDCALPVTGQVQCPTTVGQYSDPSCSVPYGIDAATGVAPDAQVVVIVGVDAGVTD